MSEEVHERVKRLTAQRKFQVYLETRDPNAPVGEILRRYGLHLADLRQIEQAVEEGAISALKIRGARHGGLREVPPQEHEQLIRELRAKEKALADLTVEYQLFKKKESWELEQEKKRKSSRIG